MQDAVIVSAVRTPVGSFGGQFKDVPATELGTHAARAALARAGVSAEDVDEVVLGCVLQAGLGQNPARQVALGGGRILVTLLHEMQRSTANRGLATLSVGGGQGQAVVIRRSSNGDAG